MNNFGCWTERVSSKTVSKKKGVFLNLLASFLRLRLGLVCILFTGFNSTFSEAQEEEVIVLHEEVEGWDEDLDEGLASGDSDEEGISDVPLGSMSEDISDGKGLFSVRIPLGRHSPYYPRATAEGRLQLARQGGGGKATEAAVYAALSWLAAHQDSQGHWDARKYGAQHKTDLACTSLALLAFLGAGHSEDSGEFKKNIQRGISYLKTKQHTNGLIAESGERYEDVGIIHPHCVAGWALVEASGMGREDSTVVAAQHAVEYSAQRGRAKNGKGDGWGFRSDRSARTDVSAWFVIHLKAARATGFNIRPEVFLSAARFLNQVRRRKAFLTPTGGAEQPGPDVMNLIRRLDSEQYEDRERAQEKLSRMDMKGIQAALYVLNEEDLSLEVRNRLQRLTRVCLTDKGYLYVSEATKKGGSRLAYLTAFGTASRQFMDRIWRDHQGAVDFIIKFDGVPHWKQGKTHPDLLHWFIGSMCLFHQGGESWKGWNAALKASLCKQQQRRGDEKGSWDPGGPHVKVLGRVGQTALGALCLETYYRYSRSNGKAK